MFIFTVVGSLLFQPLVGSGGALETQLLRHDAKREVNDDSEGFGVGHWTRWCRVIG